MSLVRKWRGCVYWWRVWGMEGYKMASLGTVKGWRLGGEGSNWVCTLLHVPALPRICKSWLKPGAERDGVVSRGLLWSFVRGISTTYTSLQSVGLPPSVCSCSSTYIFFVFVILCVCGGGVSAWNQQVCEYSCSQHLCTEHLLCSTLLGKWLENRQSWPYFLTVWRGRQSLRN